MGSHLSLIKTVPSQRDPPGEAAAAAPQHAVFFSTFKGSHWWHSTHTRTRLRFPRARTTHTHATPFVGQAIGGVVCRTTGTPSQAGPLALQHSAAVPALHKLHVVYKPSNAAVRLVIAYSPVSGDTGSASGTVMTCVACTVLFLFKPREANVALLAP